MNFIHAYRKDTVYDTAGNLTQYTDGDGITETYTFDALNRLTKRTRGDDSTLYFYTADDERILRFGSNGLQWTLRDLSGRLLREFRPEANKIQPIRDHIYRGSGLLATVNADSTVNLTEIRHQSLDHLGSPRYITDANGNFVSEHKYYPFGEEATKSTQDELPMKFTGHERDFNGEGEEDDLDYMHARYHDPQLGRFLSLDPVLGRLSNPQSWNRYAYVMGNPLKFIDPTGQTVSLTHLSESEQKELLEGLEEFTGNRYSIADNGELQLEAIGDNSSQTATKIIDEAHTSESQFSVVAKNNSKGIVLGQANQKTNEVALDFNDFADIEYGKVDPRTLGTGSVFVHELIHVSKGLRDPKGSAASTEVGPVVGYVNTIREERGFPLRGPAYSARLGIKGRVKFNFQGVNSRKPLRVYYVRVSR